MNQESANNRGKANDSAAHDPDQLLLGNQLQRERQKKHLSLEQVAEDTRIHIGTLHAIENNDRSKMPAEVFSRGFIRLYAEYLGLDAQEILERYRRELARDDDDGIFARDVFRNEKLAESTSIVNVRKVLFILFTVVFVALGYYFFFYGSTITTYRAMLPTDESRTPPAHDLAAPPQLPDQPAETTPPPLAGEEQTVPVNPADEALPAALPATETPPADTAGQTPAPLPEQTTAPRSDAVPANTVLAPLVAAPPATTAEPEAAAALRPIDLRMAFSEKTWLQVVVDDQPARDYFFHPGEENRWNAKQLIKLHLGNSGGVKIFVNDRELSVAGKSGTPLRLTIPDDTPPAEQTPAQSPASNTSDPAPARQ